MGEGDEEEAGREEVKITNKAKTEINQNYRQTSTTDKQMKNNKLKLLTVSLLVILVSMFAVKATGQINSNVPASLPMLSSAQALQEYAVEQVRQGWIYVSSQSAIETPASRTYNNRAFTNDFNPAVGIDWIKTNTFLLFVYRTNDTAQSYIQFQDITGWTLFFGNGYGESYYSAGAWRFRNPQVVLRMNDFIPLPLLDAEWAYLVQEDDWGNQVWWYNLPSDTYYTPQGPRNRLLVPAYGVGKTKLIVNFRDGSKAVYDLRNGGGGRQIPLRPMDVTVNAIWDRFILLKDTNIVHDVISDEHRDAGKTHSIFLELTTATRIYFSSWYYVPGGLAQAAYANTVSIRPYGEPQTTGNERLIDPPGQPRDHFHEETLGPGKYWIRFSDYDGGWGIDPNGFVQPWNGGGKG